MKFFYFIVRVSFYSPSGVCYNIAVKIYGDYHTHTYFSDGRRSVRENVEAAIKRGLNAVAISDHGFANPDRYSLTHKKASEQRLLIAEERSKHPEIAVFHAIEADILGLEGNIDMRPEDFENFDFVIAGFHRFATPRRPADFFTFYLPAYFSFAVKPSRDAIRRNTRAFTQMIKRYPVAIVAHLNDMVITDPKEVAKCAADYGTLLEINMKHIDIFGRALDGILATDVGLIANTDAHTPEKVGDFSPLAALLESAPELKGRIVNASENAINFRKYRY